METDITAILSRSQRIQLASLVKKLSIYGTGELELIIEAGCFKRYLLSHSPLYADLQVEVSDEEFDRLFSDTWPWWCSIASAILSVQEHRPGYGSVVVQVEGGHVRAVHEVRHIPCLPPSGPLGNGNQHK